MSEHYDLLIRGGTLIDGTGAAAIRGDVAVRDGCIAALGNIAGTADRVLEADGRVVCPGFVDIHTHYDAQIFWDRMLSISPWHGVTTVVIGNCGFGVAPTRVEHRDLILRTLENVEGMSLEALHEGLGEEWPFETFPEFLQAIENRGSAINVGALIGHTPIRMYVMGEESTEREATDSEIAQMKQLVHDALDAGAIGFATSKAPTHVGYAGRPVPSRVASFDEIKTLASALGDAGRGVMQSTVGPQLLFNELSEIQQATGRQISWTALLGGAFGPEGHRAVLDMHQKFQEEGTLIFPQVTCRPLNFEFQWKAPFPFESLSIFQPVSAADFEGKKRIYADPEFRQALKDRGSRGAIVGRWDNTVIASCPQEREIEERTVSDVAAERGVDPVDLALDLGLASNLEARFRMAIMNIDEDIVEELLTHPSVVLGLSDAGAHASQLCDACFSTHLLSHWVREKQVLSLEEAVRLLTSRSAEVFDIQNRGRLEVGLAADITVFDPETVGCSPLRRVTDLPAGADRLISEATGIHAVVVNGTILREDGRDCVDPDGDLPGQLVRSQPH